MDTVPNSKLQKELESFQTLWQGGYFEGDVLDPLASSTYGRTGFMSILYATYLKSIKPYINANTVALEIGPGRGTWTKTMLGAKKIVVMDALSAEHNGFFGYVGKQPHVQYTQVSDFLCTDLPDDTFNYMFSFGCLCHVSFEGISSYAKNLYPKLKSGSNCFWMIADYDRFNALASREDELDLLMRILRKRKMLSPLLSLYTYYIGKNKKMVPLNKNEDDTPRPGRFYHAGIDRCCEMLEKNGYVVIERDTGTNHRDPIIHFSKK